MTDPDFLQRLERTAGAEHVSTGGGLVALAACGPERLRYGAPRDRVLGLIFISGTARLISAGGRVVKNVAGYDLTRLFVASAGTLGFLTEVTFRVASLPQRCIALAASGSFSRCRDAAAELLQSKLEPTFVIALPGDAPMQPPGRGNWQLNAGFEGFEETVDFQVRSCPPIGRKEPGAFPGRQVRRDRHRLLELCRIPQEVSGAVRGGRPPACRGLFASRLGSRHSGVAAAQRNPPPLRSREKP